MDRFDREKMIELLHEFDAQAPFPIRLDICGSASAILPRELARESVDIDLVSSDPDADQKETLDLIEKISRKKEVPLDWLNVKAREAIYDTFPSYYRPELIPLQEKFSKITVYTISKPDFILTKCGITNKIRPRDAGDIKNISISDNDDRDVYRKLYHFSFGSPDHAFLTEARLKLSRPEFHLDSTGLPITTIDDIKKYVEERTGLTVPEERSLLWEDDLSSARITKADVLSAVDVFCYSHFNEANQNLPKSAFDYWIPCHCRIENYSDFEAYLKSNSITLSDSERNRIQAGWSEDPHTIAQHLESAYQLAVEPYTVHES